MTFCSRCFTCTLIRGGTVPRGGPVGHDVDSAVRPGGGNERHVIAHGLKELGHQLLELVGAQAVDVVLDLGLGSLHGLVVHGSGDELAGFLGFDRAGLLGLGGAGALPGAVLLVRGTDQLPFGKRERLLPFVRQSPVAAGLLEVSGLDAVDGVPADQRFPADGPGLVALPLVLGRLQLRLDGCEDLLGAGSPAHCLELVEDRAEKFVDSIQCDPILHASLEL